MAALEGCVPSRIEIACTAVLTGPFAANVPGIKLGGGSYIPKSHDKFQEIMEHCTFVHLAHSELWKDTLVDLIGHIWDLWVALGEDPQGHLKTLWESYFVEPWGNWTVGENEHIPCMIPSNQMVEAFFRNVVRVLGGRGQLRGSTTKVLHRMLPTIMNHQDTNLPDELCFEVCRRTTGTNMRLELPVSAILTSDWQVEYIAPKMLEKARVLAAPANTLQAPRRYRDFYYELQITFQSKFMVICNCKDSDEFKCAYVFRAKQKVFSPPLRLHEIELYEMWNHGDCSDWHRVDLTRSQSHLRTGLLRMEAELERHTDVMQALAPLASDSCTICDSCLQLYANKEDELLRFQMCMLVLTGVAQGHSARRCVAIVSAVSCESDALDLHMQGVTQDRHLLAHYCGEPPLRVHQHQVGADAYRKEAEKKACNKEEASHQAQHDAG